MKKKVSVMICFVFLLSALTGCGRSSQNDVNPGDADTDRPGVNDSVVNDQNGMVDDNGIANPNTSDRPMSEDIQDGIDNAGDAVRRGMDNVGDAVNEMTGR